jgi:hypothetical protein
MEIAITLCLFGGIICGAFASSKRRSVLGWFAIGAMFPIIGLILVIVLPPNGAGLVWAPASLPWRASHQPIDATIIGQRTHLQNATLDALDRLVQLRERGQLSDFEFQEKRAELLARI